MSKADPMVLLYSMGPQFGILLDPLQLQASGPYFGCIPVLAAHRLSNDSLNSPDSSQWWVLGLRESSYQFYIELIWNLQHKGLWA